ncbi:PREDICTED: uncharacterized protein LOC108558794 [Nicrophorus vespilloides]|uniref:Uncharacterized protein LOC108558794 n=1 Tax=Nicrophorus vespilloides TaxID=110193 RepID=A0ABM1M9R6_NICVS|nr:PREDICTED: uncharacterized protein LOC108558794 [Nicrophorus vespilloides]
MSRKHQFQYNPCDLIDLIKERPIIWDKTIDEYKDKVMKEMAWTEVYGSLNSEYENMNEKMKKKTAESINEKWKNIRDAFIRSLKKKSNKKYLYSDNLQFLLKVLDKDDTKGWVKVELPGNADFSHEESGEEQKPAAATPRPRSPKYRKRKATFEVDEPTSTTVVQTPQAFPPVENAEDKAFFMSLISSVQRFKEDETLEFRMGVLSLIQQIKQKRQSY